MKKLFGLMLALIFSLFTLSACDMSDESGNAGIVEVSSVSLDLFSASIELDENITLHETVYPTNADNKTVTWSSSNSSVAKVSNGLVTPSSIGETIITVKTHNNKTASCKIYVTATSIILGKYEQDGNVNNGKEKIKWIKIAEDNDKYLLVSKYILDYKEFNDTFMAEACSWGNSTIRSFLNYDFYYSAFSTAEQETIITSKVQDYKADGVLGNVTNDKVFLLSLQQVQDYFSSTSQRVAVATEYAKTQKKYATDSYWLINSYSSDLYKRLINKYGVNENNPRVNEPEGIRPAIWVKK